jgi:hypothetical protein
MRSTRAINRAGAFLTGDLWRADVTPCRLSEKQVHKAMSEHKRGTLNSGSGKKVKSRKQAVAIAMSESGQSKT